MAFDANQPSEVDGPSDSPRAPTRKELGAFYTPSFVSDILVNWAVVRPTDRILEPGFGGCGFIDSAIRRFSVLGQKRAEEFIFGCDVDPLAYTALNKMVTSETVEKQFPITDFMKTGLTTWPNNFSAVVGNPPYVSFQMIGAEARLKNQLILKNAGMPISARSSLWAYFVLHATTFLERGGRVAWVLPGSYLQADYAKEVRKHLESKFERIFVARIHERLFTKIGADEETVILLADGYSNAEATASVSYLEISSATDLETSVRDWDCIAQDEDSSLSCDSSCKMSLRALHDAAKPLFPTKKFSEICNVRIGVVSGDNPFFVMSTAEAVERGIPTNLLTPILSKYKDVSGLELLESDVAAAGQSTARCWLATRGDDEKKSDALSRYFNSYSLKKRDEVGTFKKRKIWHNVDDGKIPDAFWPVMRDVGPTLAINTARINCTNTIHRVFAKPGVSSDDLKLAAIGLLSTIGQLSAEMLGRHYGSGVLKHEPSDAMNVEIPWIANLSSEKIQLCFSAIDHLLRKGERKAAQKIADDFFKNSHKSITKEFINQCETRLKDIRIKRMPKTRLIIV